MDKQSKLFLLVTGATTAGAYGVAMALTNFPESMANIKNFVLTIMSLGVLGGYVVGAVSGYFVGRRLRLKSG